MLSCRYTLTSGHHRGIARPADVFGTDDTESKKEKYRQETDVTYFASITGLPSAMACAKFCPHVGGVVILSAMDCFRLFLHIAQNGRFRVGLRP
jgi:hypothetical protein